MPLIINIDVPNYSLIAKPKKWLQLSNIQSNNITKCASYKDMKSHAFNEIGRFPVERIGCQTDLTQTI